MMALLQRLRGLSQSCSEGWNLFIRVKLQARGMSSYSRLYYDEWLIQEFPSSLLHQIHTEEHNVDSTGPRGITCFSSASVYPDRQADELCRLSSSSVFLECVIKQKYYPRLLHGNVLGRYLGSSICYVLRVYWWGNNGLCLSFMSGTDVIGYCMEQKNVRAIAWRQTQTHGNMF